MLITHKQSLIMLSITCRCILYALVSVVVPWGVALGWVRMRLGGEKSTVYSLQKARLHHCIYIYIYILDNIKTETCAQAQNKYREIIYRAPDTFAL